MCTPALSGSSHMRYRVLGTVSVDAAGGAPVPLGERQRAVLAALLARAGEVVPVDLDAARFDRLVAAAAGAPPERAATLLGEALDLWRGSAYAEFAETPVA